MPVLEVDEEVDQLERTVQSKLAHCRGTMGFGGTRADVQPSADLSVGETVGSEGDDLAFPPREQCESGRNGWGGTLSVGLQNTFKKWRTDVAMIACHPAQGSQDLVCFGSLKHIRPHSAAHRFPNEAVVIKPGENHDASIEVVRSDVSSQLQTGGITEINPDDDNIGIVLVDLREGLVPLPRLADNLDAVDTI